jgi:RNA polymerase sigma-70 factor, ECF subfamily
VQSDEQLADSARRGDRAAFGTLVNRYQERLLRFLQTRCRSRADAEDVMQDAFVDAWRYLQSYNSRWRFSTWLYRIAIRRAARQPSGPEVPEGSEVLSTDDPLAACIAADDRENLWLTARRELTEDAVSALWLHSVEEMALKDIANALQRSLPWTKVSLMRSRRRLQSVLAAQATDKAGTEAYG